MQNRLEELRAETFLRVVREADQRLSRRALEGPADEQAFGRQLGRYGSCHCRDFLVRARWRTAAAGISFVVLRSSPLWEHWAGAVGYRKSMSERVGAVERSGGVRALRGCLDSTAGASGCHGDAERRSR